MSDYVDGLIKKIEGCSVAGIESYMWEVCDSLPHSLFEEHDQQRNEAVRRARSLGENARRMLEIGRIQDELVVLGFEWFDSLGLVNDAINVQVEFFVKKAKWYVVIRSARHMSVCYCLEDVPTWQQDVRARVKELLNHA